MILKRHLSGVNIVIAKNEGGKKYQFENDYPKGREQGSLYGQQKRLISDCCEAMRLYYERFEPVIFCLTSPVMINKADEPKFLDKFLKQLRKNGLENYVWVREKTGNGFPHFHFIAEIPFKFENIGGKWFKILAGRSVVDWSVLWSSYFDSDSRNSIRLGTGYKSGKIKYFLRSGLMSSYLCKYIGKGLGKDDLKPLENGRKVSNFGTSTRSGKRVKGSFRFIEPEIYEPQITINQYAANSRKILRNWYCVESPMDNNNGTILTDKDLSKIHWRQCGMHPVYMGFPKRTKRIKK